MGYNLTDVLLSAACSRPGVSGLIAIYIVSTAEYHLQGVKFEPNSFKLTHEMIVLMGGRYSQGYSMFTQMTVKAFLALRPYADQLVNTAQLMLGTSLPSFKGDGTIKRMRDRFALHLSDREAADWMMSIVKDAYENYRTTFYDEFQRVSIYLVHCGHILLIM